VLVDARSIGLTICILAAAAACGGREAAPVDPDQVAIARVGDRDVTRGAFAAYLLASLGDPAEVARAGPEVRSRLLDQFLDEEAIVAAALDDGTQVAENDLRGLLRGGGDPEGARRMLLAKNYREEVILKGISVDEMEIEAYYRANLAAFQQPSRLILRKILLDSPEEAREVHAEIARDPASFELVADARSLSPEGGRAQAYDEGALPEMLREAIAHLKEGEVSALVEDPQGFFILKVEERRPERTLEIDEVRDRIEFMLLQERSERRYREFVEDLRRRTPIEVLADRLDFPYVPKDPS
jgi:hypothetical protein